MGKQELAGGEDGPREILDDLPPVGRGVDAAAERAALIGTGRPAERRQVDLVDDVAAARVRSRASAAMRPSSSISFLFSVSPLIACSACGSVGSICRSAADVSTRSGRPNTVRKYESTFVSGSCRARVPRRIAIESRRHTRHLRVGIEDHLRGSRRVR